MTETLDAFCRDVNALAAWLALNELDELETQPNALSNVETIVYMGNQAIATLPAACALARRLPAAQLLLCGGVGHATLPFFENLRRSEFGALIDEGAIQSSMAEAEMAAVVAGRVFGIAAGRILLETDSRNCGENARFSLRTLEGFFRRPADAVVLQDPTMQRRAVLTWQHEAEAAGWKGRAVSHAAFVPAVEPGPEGALQMATGAARASWTVERFLGLVLGEMSRLNDDQNGYGPRGRGFLPHVEIPAELTARWRRMEASPLAGLASR